jgi:hypothetical protein
MPNRTLNAERLRLENQRAGLEDWRLWGPYLAERAAGTVREDYSEQGMVWEHLDHDQARSRAYRWSEGVHTAGRALFDQTITGSERKTLSAKTLRLS